MKKVLLSFAVIILLATVAFGSYILGAKAQLKRLSIQLEAGQAMLGFNHLLRFRELESDLSKGCSDEALEKVKVSIAAEMHLLSSFYQKHENTWLNNYITDRDPQLLAQLKAYKSPYENPYREPQCAK